MKNKNIIIRVTEVEYKNYKKIAKLLETTLSDMIRNAIIEYVTKENRK